MEAAGIWTKWDQSPIKEINLPFKTPKTHIGWVDDYGKGVFAKNRNLFTGQCNFIFVPGIFGATGCKITATNLVLIGSDEFVNSFDPARAEDDDQGMGYLMKRTMAHEFGHWIGINVKEKWRRFPNVPAVNAEGYHDVGMFPPLFPQITGKSSRGLMQPGPFIGLEGITGNPGRWMRHEDWREANESAKRTLSP